MRLITTLAAAAALAFGLHAAPAGAQSDVSVPAGFQLQTTTSGLSQPIGMAYTSDGRVFVTQKRGRVYVARTDSSQGPTLLLDIQAKVNNFGDRGLLGIAADRDFATNGFVYLLYAYDLNQLSPDSDGAMVSRLTRIKVNADNSLANPESPETVILGTHASGPCPAPSNAVDCIPADWFWHTIGTVRSDPVDGTLWLGSGDATAGETQPQALRTYDEQSFSGKIIHIDRNGRGLPGHPFCPQETDLNKVCTKIYAKGFRNPFRFSVRPNKGPVVGDVGHTSMEELDLVKPGRNYGWPCYEGTGRPAGYRQYAECQALYAKEGTAEGATFPDYSYAHVPDVDASINGGPQYTGTGYPAEYRNDIFFGDYAQGWIKRLKVDANDKVLSVQPFAENLYGFVDLGIDRNGRLAIVDAGGLKAGLGAVRRFEFAGDLKPVARASGTPTSGSAPLAVQFTGNTSSDPEGKALTYDWDFGDGTAHSTAANPSHTYTANGSYTAKLTVKDPAGGTGTATVDIAVGNTPPTAGITAPTAGDLYVTGSTVQLRGGATDPQDGTVPGTSLSWEVTLHHGSHVHDHAAATGASTSFVTDRGHDADAYYEIRLIATDSKGLTDIDTVTIKPQTAKLALSSSPPGAPLSYAGGEFAAAPLRRTAAVGYSPTIAAAETFVRNGRTYRFKGWSDGGARMHAYTIPAADKGLLARYEADGVKTFTFTPTADAYVDSFTPEANFGQSSVIGVDGAPARRSLMKFDLRGLEGGRVVGARLALYPTNESPAGGRVFKTVSTWQENRVTWNTKPPFQSILRGTFGAVRAAEWTEIGLGSGSVTADGLLTLGMDSTIQNGATYASRHTSSRPQLTVEVQPVPTETLRFTPTADTYVAPAAPNTAYGTSQALIADADPRRTAYVRFNVSGLGGRPVYASKLRLHQTDASNHGGRIMQMTATRWSEGATFNTRPPYIENELGAFGAVSAGQWYQSYLRAQSVKGEGPVSFAIAAASTDSSQWASRESLNKPELLVVVPAAAPGR